MNQNSSNLKFKESNSINFYDYNPEQANFHDEVIKGLKSNPKNIAPKFFYDEKGSNLFDAICESTEYYPTRTEMQILHQNQKEIAAHFGENCLLIEPGSGSSQKVRILMDSVSPKAYMPMDISKDYLRLVAEDIANEYPWLEVHAACVDYSRPFSIPQCHETARKVAFFPGSSIGNFDPENAIQFLQHMANMLESDGGLLIGVDLKKSSDTLNAAYNDTEGATAAFNQNLLTRMNSELQADFDLDNFHHHAFYNEKLSRIEMHLVSTETQVVSVNGHNFVIKKDETIHTENSYKYTIEEFQTLASKAGFKPVNVWTDSDNLFSVHYFEMK
ncbi:MAG: L-histidine N(alpha)-methyltransferase [Gammaproteobacteria bacterium]